MLGDHIGIFINTIKGLATSLVMTRCHLNRGTNTWQLSLKASLLHFISEMHFVNIVIVDQIISSLHIWFPAVRFFSNVTYTRHHRTLRDVWSLINLYTYRDSIYVVHNTKFLVLGTKPTSVLSALRLTRPLWNTVNGRWVENTWGSFCLFSSLRSFPKNRIEWTCWTLLGRKCADLSHSTRTSLEGVG